MQKKYMIFRTLAALMALFMLFGVSSCTKKKGCTDPTSLNYDPDAEEDDNSCEYDIELYVPSTYNFANVLYTGQTVRMLLLQDLNSEIGKATTTALTKQQLVDLFEKNNEDLGKHTSISTGKNLKGAFLASPLNSSIKQMWLDTLYGWFQQIADLSGPSGTYVRADGVDLKQAVEKTIMGAVFYDQAVNKYLNLVPDDDNTTVTDGKGTSMEHHFDEAFGYFGAARDYNNWTDAEIKSPGEKDANSDTKIDPTSEKCFYYAQTAAKRDLGAAGLSSSSQTDYTKTLFYAWLKGRAAISANAYMKRDDAIKVIKKNWEEIIAATVVHYVNETKSDLANSGADLNKHWSEMRYYFAMITFYPDNKLGATNIAAITADMGNNPSGTNATKLSGIASKLKSAYGFSDEQITNWRQ